VPRLSRDWLKLYLVTDGPACCGRSLEDVAAAAVRGGATCVQLREKNASTREFLALALALHRVLQAAGVPLVINDRLDIALACSAEGLHLGQSDMPVNVARQLLPQSVFLGLSLENERDLADSHGLDVDYLAVSPVFPTPTKTDTQRPWGIQGLAFVRARTGLPLVAIGGIDSANAAGVIGAGADGIAVVSAICSADDPETAARQLRLTVDRALEQTTRSGRAAGPLPA
jgi:thiamine-phosphate pyrophosphorylase